MTQDLIFACNCLYSVVLKIAPKEEPDVWRSTGFLCSYGQVGGIFSWYQGPNVTWASKSQVDLTADTQYFNDMPTTWHAHIREPPSGTLCQP